MTDLPTYGCAVCRDEGIEPVFMPKSVKEQMEHAKQVHGSTRFDHPSWQTASALELLGKIMRLPAK